MTAYDCSFSEAFLCQVTKVELLKLCYIIEKQLSRFFFLLTPTVRLTFANF